MLNDLVLSPKLWEEANLCYVEFLTELTLTIDQTTADRKFHIGPFLIETTLQWLHQEIAYALKQTFPIKTSAEHLAILNEMVIKLKEERQ